MGRRQVNLRRLPTWAQYLIGIAVAVLVGALAWSSGRHRETPGWVSGGIKVAGVVFAAVAVGWLIYKVWQRLSR